VKRIFISIILTVGFIPISSYSAGAIYGGSLSIGDTRVVKIWEDESIYNGCSAALLTPQIVISAAHCTDVNTPHEGMAYETSAFIPAKQWWASPPGIDGSVVDLSTRVKIVKGYITKGYKNIWPCTSSGCTQQDDIVFYILEKPLVTSYSIPIATEADVAKIKQQKMVVTHIGYGYQGDVKSSKNIDGKPYKIPGTAVNEIIRIGNPPKETNKIIRTIQSKTQSLCPGDSGSPVYVNINGVEKNLAVQFAGRGLCTGLEPGELPSSDSTLVYPYIGLLRAEPLAASLIAEYDRDVAADKAAAARKATSITCVKGKLTKKVNAVKPVCPTGYKKK
jgi:V8-like Glu-specific endopeptidase